MRLKRFFPVLIAALVTSVVFWGASVTQAEFGVNWTAQYYNNETLNGSPVLVVQNITGVNFNWGNGSPDPSVNVDSFSARFTSTQTFNAGDYEFVATSDDGVRVYIDGQLALDKFISRVLTTDRFTRTMTAGTHTLIVEYSEIVDIATVQFQWFQVGNNTNPGVIIPNITPAAGYTPIASQGTQQALFTPTPAPTAIPPTPLPAIPPGAITATVIRAQVLLARDLPYAGATEVTRLLRGQMYHAIGRDPQGRWYLLQLTDRQAWAMAYYLYIDADPLSVPVVSRFVTIGNPGGESGVVGQSTVVLRVRSAPTTDAEVLMKLNIGDIVAITGRNAANDWYQIRTSTLTGWVSAEWIRIIEGDGNTLPVL
jgi:hypothetical protein